MNTPDGPEQRTAEREERYEDKLTDEVDADYFDYWLARMIGGTLVQSDGPCQACDGKGCKHCDARIDAALAKAEVAIGGTLVQS